MANSNVANMTVGLHFADKDFKNSQIKAQKEFENTGDKLTSMAKATGTAMAAGLAAAAAGVTAITKAAVQSYADYEQLVGGVETLFKESAGVVEEYANQAYVTAGVSANKYMETVTSFSASLLQGLGGDTAAAAKIANQAVIDMADNANKMGTSIEMIQNAYQGFAKQNYTMLDNLKLGYGGTASEMARLINDSGVLGDTMKVTASTVNSVSFDKMVQAIHVVQDNLGITGTTALEASETISGSLNSMKASWQNLLTGMVDPAQDFGKLFDKFIASVETFAGNLIPAITKALSHFGIVGKTIAGLMEFSIGFVKFLASNKWVMDMIIAGVTAILSLGIIMKVQKLTASLGVMFRAITLFATANPLLVAITAAVAALVFLVRNFDTVKAVAENVGRAINEFMGAAATFITEAFQGAYNAITSIFGGIGSFFQGVWSTIVGIFTNIGTAIGDAVSGAFKAVVNTILGFVEGFINTPVRAINALIDVINAVPGIEIGHLDELKLPRLAQGGLATGTSTAIIGEAGTEAVLPLERNTGNWSGLLASALADEFEDQGYGERGIVVNFYDTTIRDDDDIKKITQGISQVMRRQAV